MQVNIQILCDNLLDEQQVLTHLQAEHGFAAWFSAPNFNLLFDTGSGQTLQANADALNINLSECQCLVLSHGHYDHTGGIDAFYESGAHCPVLAHPDITKNRYSCHKGKAVRSIGITAPSLMRLNTLPVSQKHWHIRGQMLSHYLGSTGQVQRLEPLEDTGGPFFLDRTEKIVDEINDDQALWINSPAGLVIVAGCCHSGIINTIKHVQELTGIKRIAGIIGGLHLLHASDERLQASVDFLQDCGPDFIHLSHCSGNAAYELLATQLANTEVSRSYVGASYHIDLQALS